MSVQSNVPTGIHISKPTNTRAARKDGARCHDTSCTCGRDRRARRSATQVGQAVTSDLFLKNKQEQSKYNLLVFVAKLLGLYASKDQS